ncbi:MAG: DUF4252 domain-containing protein [Acidobacteriota bacterium]
MPPFDHRRLAERAGRWLVAGLLAAGLLIPSPAWAKGSKPDWHDHPGFFPLDKLGILERKDLTVEINLQGAMLRMVAKAVRATEPEFAGVIEDLRAVRVQVAEVEELDLEAIGRRVATASEWLESNDWQAVVRTRDQGEQTHIYTRDIDDEIHGMAILVVDASEVVVINIVGGIDLEQVVGLGEALGIRYLTQTHEDQTGEEPEP